MQGKAVLEIQTRLHEMRQRRDMKLGKKTFL